MHIWEESAIDGFTELSRRRLPILRELGGFFLWDEGFYSCGDRPLFYGLPAFQFLKAIGPSIFALRIPAVLCALAGLAIFLMVARAELGERTARICATLIVFSAAYAFYGSYAGTAAASWLAFSLTLSATIGYLRAPGFIRAALAAAAICLASLHYAVLRPTLMVLSAALPLWHLARGWRRWPHALLFAALIASFVAFQTHMGKHPNFLSSRGEQILNIEPHTNNYINRVIRHDLGFTRSERTPKIVALLVWHVTLPQYLARLDPRSRFSDLLDDPPFIELFAPFLWPFIIIGLALGIRRCREPFFALNLAFLVTHAMTVLSSSRVDAHRLSPILFTLHAFAAVGISWCWRELFTEERAAGRARAFGGAILASWMLWVLAAFWAAMPEPRFQTALRSELFSKHNRVWVNADMAEYERRWISFGLLERNLSEPLRAKLAANEFAESDRAPELVRLMRSSLRNFASAGTLILIPAERFRHTARDLFRSGFRVGLRRGPQENYYKVDAGLFLSGLSDEQFGPISGADDFELPSSAGKRRGLVWRPARLADNRASSIGRLRVTSFTETPIIAPRGAELFVARAGSYESIKGCQPGAMSVQLRETGGRVLYDRAFYPERERKRKKIKARISGQRVLLARLAEAEPFSYCYALELSRAGFLVRRRASAP